MKNGFRFQVKKQEHDQSLKPEAVFWVEPLER